MKNPHKRPRVPRSLCRTKVHWLGGIVSPSHWLAARLQGIEPEYFRQEKAYELRTVRWKIQQRICSRGEWDWYRYQRYKRREGYGSDRQALPLV